MTTSPKRTTANHADAKAVDIGHDLVITKTARRASAGGTWVVGTISGHRFEAPVFPAHADNPEFELGDSRISKLWVQRIADKTTVAHFDRGWGRRPANPTAAAIVDFLAAGLADQAMGKILAELDAKRYSDETLIIVTADHGGHNLRHGTDLPEDMTIPWIVSGPGVAATTISAPVYIMDTAATAAYALGLPIPVEWEGYRSVKPSVRWRGSGRAQAASSPRLFMDGAIEDPGKRNAVMI